MLLMNWIVNNKKDGEVMLVRTIDGFRFLIDPNDPARQSSNVVVSHIPPEEIEKKYGPVNKNYDKRKCFSFILTSESSKRVPKKGGRHKK